MKKNNLMKLLGIALVVAIVSTGVFYGLFVNTLTSSTGSGKTLVVAAKPLKAGLMLQAGDLKTIPWPTDLPSGAYATVDEAVGKTVFDAIGPNEPVMTSRLASEASAGGAGVAAGMRAVAVHVSDSTGILALLRAGQTVDVQVVLNRKDAAHTTEVRTAIENLTVLAVHPQPEQTSQGQSLPEVTLLARPEEADVLAAADSGARVRLTLRNPLDHATRVRAPLMLDSVMKESGSASQTSDAVSLSATRP